MSRMWAGFAVGIVAAAVSGCEREWRPSGHYEVVTTLSGDLPLVVQRDPMCVHTLHKAAADFNRNGTYTSSFQISHECQNQDKPAVDDAGVKNGTFRMANDTVFLYNDAKKFTGFAVRRGEDTLFVRGASYILVMVKQ